MGELAKIDSFKREVAIVETIEEMKLLTTKGELIAGMAKKLKIPKKGQDELGRTRIELAKKLRVVIEEKFPHGGDRSSSRNRNLKDSGINKNESSDAKIITEEEEIADEVMDEIANSKEIITPQKVANEVRKKKRKEKIRKQKEDIKTGKIKQPEGLFDLIVIDPPWSYNSESYDPETQRGVIDYPILTQNELLNIQLPAGKDCILWLWTTHSFIWDAKELMNKWGFEYKAILVWDKIKMGIGRWLRLQTEFCLLGIKGKPLWDTNNVRDIISEKRREHSRKPDAFYDMIDTNFVGKKLDYFGREQRKGWILYGNETERF